MGERKELAVTLTVMIGIAILANFAFNLDKIPSGIYSYEIENYSARITRDGMLYENYTYRVDESGKYHMLYRFWNSPLWYINMSREGIFIKSICVHFYSGGEEEVIPYVRDNFGSVWLLEDVNNSEAINYVVHHAKYNEAGVYFPNGIPRGRYMVSYAYLLKPVLDYDGRNYRLTLSLASSHPRYNSVIIQVPVNFHVFPSPYLKVEKRGMWWDITGFVADETHLKVDMVFRDGTNFSHYSIRRVGGDLLGDAQWSSAVDSTVYWLFYMTAFCPYAIIILIPVVYFAYYLLRGREKKYPDPGEIYTPPADRDPFTVNYVFKNEGYIDYYYVLISTLLYLRKRGYIDISPDGKRIFVKSFSYDDLDPYSQNLLRFLKRHSMDDVFDLEAIKIWIETNRKDRYWEIKPYLNNTRSLLMGSKKDEILKKYMAHNPIEFFENMAFSGFLPATISTVFVVLLRGEYVFFWLESIMLSILLILQSLVALRHPAILAHWRDDYYLEKLKWDRFAEFLKNEKKLKEKYLEFGDYYEDWLIYGYALGVGHKVQKVLSMPEINFPIARIVDSMRPYLVYAFAYGIGGSPKGTSAASGGGFGGGGAGAR